MIQLLALDSNGLPERDLSIEKGVRHVRAVMGAHVRHNKTVMGALVSPMHVKGQSFPPQQRCSSKRTGHPSGGY